MLTRMGSAGRAGAHLPAARLRSLKGSRVLQILLPPLIVFSLDLRTNDLTRKQACPLKPEQTETVRLRRSAAATTKFLRSERLSDGVSWRVSQCSRGRSRFVPELFGIVDLLPISDRFCH